MKYLIIILGFFLSSCTGSSEGHTGEVVNNHPNQQTLKVVCFESDHLPCSEQFKTIEEATHRFRTYENARQDVGLELDIIAVYELPDSPKISRSLVDYRDRLDAAIELVNQAGIDSSDALVHILLPPVYDSSGVDYGGGVASGTCTINTLNGYSYSISRKKNLAGEDRQEQSVVSALHEISHSLGATHTDNVDPVPNIMYQDAISYVREDATLPWSQVTIAEIRACFLRVGRSSYDDTVVMDQPFN